MLSLLMVFFCNMLIVYGESTPNPIEFSISSNSSNEGEAVTRSFTLSRDTQVRYSFSAAIYSGGYIKITGPGGQIYYRNSSTSNVYAGSFPGMAGATYQVTVKGGVRYSSYGTSTYFYGYGNINLTIRYYELNPGTMMYDFKLSGPYDDDSNCSQTYNLYLPNPKSVSTGCYGRSNSVDFNSSSDAVPLNYPVYVWWSYSVSNGKDENNTSPEFRITVLNENNQQTAAYTSSGGSFILPKKHRMRIYTKTGDTIKKTGLFNTSKDHYSYVVDYRIYYKLDDEAPGVPGQPQPVNGNYDPVTDKYYVKSNTDGCILLSWNDAVDNGPWCGPANDRHQTISGIDGYNIKVNGVELQSGYELQSENGKTTAVINSQYFTQYQNSVEIQAFDVADNYGAWSPAILLTVDNNPPDGPVNLKCSSTGADPVIWTWDPATDSISGIKQYHIRVINQNTGITVQEDTVPADSFSYRCNGLTDFTTYQFTVTAEDLAGNLGQPVRNIVTIIRSAPAVTIPEYPCSFNNGNLKFTWNHVSDTSAGWFKGYQAAITETDTPPATGQTITTNSITFNNCSSRKTWYLWVRAVVQPDNPGPWTMAGPYPDFSINGPDNGLISKEAIHKITVIPRVTGKDLRYTVRYQAESQVLVTGEAQAGVFTTLEFPFEANWKWWLEVSEYKDGVKIPESTVVTEPFHLRFDRTESAGTGRGTLFNDEVWSGIHYIRGDVIVPAGLKLTVQPDTQVIVERTSGGTGHALIIEGKLNTNTGVSFATLTGNPGDWRGILVEGEAILAGVTIRHAERGVAALYGAKVTLNDCIFEFNLAGVHTFGSNPVINGSLFRKNEYGIKEDEDGKPVVKGCRFTENGIDYYHRRLTELSMEQLNGIPGNEGNSK